MSPDNITSDPANFFAWMIFTTFIIGWFGGCLVVLADLFSEIRLILQGVPREERPKGHRVLKKYVRRDDLE